MKNNTILIIQTGGTIDKDYPKKTGGYAFEIGTPAVSRILKRINPDFEFSILELFRKDSTEITENEREQLKKVCCESTAQKIIITHGTDTMIETAQYLSSIKDKCIVITGAQLPEKFKDSDADFNFGFALGVLTNLKNGVFIAMNGGVFCPHKISRDKESGKFSHT
jgi:L-asparaginase